MTAASLNITKPSASTSTSLVPASFEDLSSTEEVLALFDEALKDPSVVAHVSLVATTDLTGSEAVASAVATAAIAPAAAAAPKSRCRSLQSAPTTSNFILEAIRPHPPTCRMHRGPKWHSDVTFYHSSSSFEVIEFPDKKVVIQWPDHPKKEHGVIYLTEPMKALPELYVDRIELGSGASTQCISLSRELTPDDNVEALPYKFTTHHPAHTSSPKGSIQIGMLRHFAPGRSIFFITARQCVIQTPKIALILKFQACNQAWHKGAYSTEPPIPLPVASTAANGSAAATATASSGTAAAGTSP